MTHRTPLRTLAAAAALLAAAACAPAPAPHVVSAQRMLMGTIFRIEVVAADDAAARAAMQAALDEVARVERPLSEWRDDSEISAVNRAAGGPPVRVGPELLEVLRRARRASEVTDGAFDVTFASCGHLWSIKDRRIPTPEAVAACLPEVDWRKVEIDPAASTVRLPGATMRIGIAGIGKGYGIDRAAAVLEARGFTDYTVDGGGDLRVRGRKPSGPWSVGIAHPRREGDLLGVVHVDRGAIVTSGDYEQYFERDGVRYHHILDPRTGMPARAAIAATVVASDATDADALATGLFVLGPERGIAVAEHLPGVEALIVAPDLSWHRTSGFPAIEPAE